MCYVKLCIWQLNVLYACVGSYLNREGHGGFCFRGVTTQTRNKEGQLREGSPAGSLAGADGRSQGWLWSRQSSLNIGFASATLAAVSLVVARAQSASFRIVAPTAVPPSRQLSIAEVWTGLLQFRRRCAVWCDEALHWSWAGARAGCCELRILPEGVAFGDLWISVSSGSAFRV